MQFSNDNLQWNLSFIIYIQDRKVDLVIAFYGMLYSLRLRQGGENRIWWIPSEREKFEGRFFKSYLVREVHFFLERVFEESNVPLTGRKAAPGRF